MYQSNTRGTVKDKAKFSAEEDVSALRKAIEGIGKLSVLVLGVQSPSGTWTCAPQVHAEFSFSFLLDGSPNPTEIALI